MTTAYCSACDGRVLHNAVIRWMGNAMSALFLPLRKIYFEAFANGEKTEEYRLYGPRWNERVCAIARPVTLSCGYSGQRLYGAVSGFRTLPVRQVPGVSDVYPDASPSDRVAVIAITLTT